MSGHWNPPADIELRLRQALAPVDPPEELELRLEGTLGSLVELAADELEAWELAAIKDPRNWPRAALGPAAAVLIGSGAAVGLVVLRTQRRRHRRRAQAHNAMDLAERTLRDVAREALRVFDDASRSR
ncbi:MAG: hypothetical protein QOF17_291 [Solirubrobacteraceae bacterium]|jgi:hypothetical protein|nr:hypothetical protein [Solirubrobacteraceae bacterium]